MRSLILLLLAAAVLPLRSQTPPAPAEPAAENGGAEAPKKGAIQVKFLAEQVPAGMGQVYLAMDKLKSKPFVLPTNNLSQPVGVAVRDLVLRTETKDLPLASITLPGEGKAFAVVLVAAKPSGYKAIVVRSDDPGFRAGDVYFINRSARQVQGRLGSTQIMLEPGTVTKSRPASPKQNSYYDVAFASREDDGWKIISQSRWPVDNQVRSYVFFFTSADGRTRFRSVDDYILPEAKEKP